MGSNVKVTSNLSVKQKVGGSNPSSPAKNIKMGE